MLPYFRGIGSIEEIFGANGEEGFWEGSTSESLSS
jgi:hypothetical protein